MEQQKFHICQEPNFTGNCPRQLIAGEHQSIQLRQEPDLTGNSPRQLIVVYHQIPHLCQEPNLTGDCGTSGFAAPLEGRSTLGKLGKGKKVAGNLFRRQRGRCRCGAGRPRKGAPADDCSGVKEVGAGVGRDVPERGAPADDRP